MQFNNIAKWVSVSIVLAIILATASAQTAPTVDFGTQAGKTSGSPNGIRAGHVLVRFKTKPNQDVLNQLNAAFGARLRGTIAGIEAA